MQKLSVIKRLKPLLFVVPGLVVLSSTAVKSTTSTESTKPAGLVLELGHNDFVAHCASCHGVSGKGDGTVAEFLTIPAPDITQLKKMNGGIFPRERIYNVIDGRAEVKVHGPRYMPVWGDWFKEESSTSAGGKVVAEQVVRERIDALITFLETIQEK